jgi:pilus assembly protein CpaF
VMQEIFSFERKGLTAAGKVRGNFRSSGIRSRFASRLAAAGFPVRVSLFEPEEAPASD